MQTARNLSRERESDPYTLYVDELSPDGVKAVVSDKNSVFGNLSRIQRTLGSLTASVGKVYSGVAILPAGRYICMVSRSPKNETTGVLGGVGMILLDLTGREEMGYKIAEKFNDKDLEERFMEVLSIVSADKEHHETFQLVIGTSPRKFFL